MKFKNLRKYILLIVGIIFVTVITYQLIEIHPNAKLAQVESSKQENLSIEQANSSKINKISNLQDKYQNPDIKGILSIEEQFNYPVAQTIDNDYYLNHNYYKESDKLGSIYLDYRVNLETSKKILIYGHSSTKQDTYFNTLENYYDEDYYNNHKYITLETETNIYRYEIFSVYVETSDFTYMNMNFDTKEEWYSHILKLQNKSLYETDIPLEADDNILIMQTCSNHPNYQNYSKKYLLIVSRRVKK